MTQPPGRGYEASRLDRMFAVDVPDDASRHAIFDSAVRILAHGPADSSPDVRRTGLALGYVQSGKTMSFTALTALAADNGYQLIVAFLGSIKMLLDQNTARLVDDLGVAHRDDYTWVHLDRPNPSKCPPSRLDDYLNRGKPVLVTVLKHAGRIRDVAAVLKGSKAAKSVRTLVIDDEADQVSLNTKIRNDETSRTYEEIVALRDSLGPHLYVQYTATPFAPLLIEARDALSPDFVEVLQPGPDYTGGETFFVGERAMIVRTISDVEADDKQPSHVPAGLRTALGTFFVGAAILQSGGVHRGPVSMLVHPSHLNVVQAGYRDLVAAVVDAWKQRLRRAPGDPGREHDVDELLSYAQDLARFGVPVPPRDEFAGLLADALVDAEVWLVNSMSDLQAIDWRRSPIHVLIGGNKLDRGFTVKGLTVTYMTRAAAKSQADTVEQRARAFGYKRPYLKFCRFYAPENVIATFAGLVHTEDDMRASLLEWAAAGRPLSEWAEDAGLVLPAGLKPTRLNVLAINPALFRGTGWHTLRRPDLERSALDRNAGLVRTLGLDAAPVTGFGRVAHPHLRDVDVAAVVDLLEEWRVTASPGWQHDKLFDYVGRSWRDGALRSMDILLMQDPSGGPRRRGWTEPLGMPNLMQGSDAGTGYPGDRNLLPDRPQLQVHWVRIPAMRVDEAYTLALYLPPGGGFPEVVARRGA